MPKRTLGVSKIDFTEEEINLALKEYYDIKGVN